MAATTTTPATFRRETSGRNAIPSPYGVEGVAEVVDQVREESDAVGEDDEDRRL
jgi:hypothetical protein